MDVMQERRAGARQVLAIGSDVHEGLAGALVAEGWTVRPWADEPDALPGIGLVAGGSDAALDAALAAAEVVRAAGDGFIALLCGSASDEQGLRAAALTPFVHAVGLPSRVLARLIAAAAETWGRAHRATGIARASRRLLCIRLGESVEIDGLPVALGLAERNFLYELALTDDSYVGKSGSIQAGDVFVKARECRRRLGKRLGAAVAEMLVPQQRGEPYRLRRPAEIERLPGPEAWRLRIVGRASVRTVYMPHVEDF